MIGQAIVVLWVISCVVAVACVSIAYILSKAHVLDRVVDVLLNTGATLAVICLGTGALGLISMIIWAFFTGQMGPN